MKRALYYLSVVLWVIPIMVQPVYSQSKQLSGYCPIKEVVDLNGGEMIFKNAILDFKSGGIKNGTIRFEDVTIKGKPYFSNISFCGNLSTPIKTCWFVINSINDLIKVFESFGKCSGEKHIIIDEPYTFDYSAFSQNQQVLFELTSNSIVEFSKKGKFCVLSSKRIFHQNGLFGVNPNVYAENIKIINANIEGQKMEDFGACLFMALSSPYFTGTHINNVIINGARLVNFGGALYCVQTRSLTGVGTEERSHKNIIVKNCYQYGNTSGMFCTVDGENIQVIDNYCDANNDPYSYDAISCHSGVNILIKGNTFKRFNNAKGMIINIRNSEENNCGSKNIEIVNNKLLDSPNCHASLSVSLSNEQKYGVHNVKFSHNVVKNCSGILVLTGGRGHRGLLSDIVIKDNILNLRVGSSFIFSAQTLVSKPQNISVTDNKVVLQINDEAVNAITFSCVDSVVFKKNTITIKGMSNTPASAIYVDYYENIEFTDNNINAGHHKIGGFVRGSGLIVNNNKYRKKNKSKDHDIVLPNNL